MRIEDVDAGEGHDNRSSAPFTLVGKTPTDSQEHGYQEQDDDCLALKARSVSRDDPAGRVLAVRAPEVPRNAENQSGARDSEIGYLSGLRAMDNRDDYGSAQNLIEGVFAKGFIRTRRMKAAPIVRDENLMGGPWTGTPPDLEVVTRAKPNLSENVAKTIAISRHEHASSLILARSDHR
jgi:hypothetical protein